MFGYVSANYQELTQQQKNRYGSVYCGICLRIREQSGNLSRIALSYDMAFLALLHMSLYEPEETSGKNACLMHPIKRRDWVDCEAVRYAAGRYKGHQWLCASAARLPVADGSVGLLTSLFAVTLPEEFHRVLKDEGWFIQVLAAEDHLLGLKGIIYPQLTHKEKDSVPQLPGFQLIKSVPLSFTFTVEGEQVQNLLSMTPHVYRISKEGAQRLQKTQTLTDTASCVLNLYRKA